MKASVRTAAKIAAAVIGLIILLVAAMIIWEGFDSNEPVKFVRNETLPTIKADWKGTPVDAKGRFVNDEYPRMQSTPDLLRFFLSPNPQRQEKLNDAGRLEIKDAGEMLAGSDDGIVWLGHASFFIRIDGVSILTDPVFGSPPFVREFVSVPSPIDQLKQVDLVLLSHDHRDHTDETTLRMIAERFPNAAFLAGLGMEDILNDWKTPSNAVMTAGWFQQFQLGERPVEIYFLPARHWSRRGLFDTNRRLWGSFVIKGTENTIYFGGDSGYGRHFREAGELFPEIDHFLVGIGAHEPRWFMEPNHTSPDDAVKAFRDSRARILIPMHFGRFDLSNEPPSEPARSLSNAAAAAGITDQVRILSINETVKFSD